ncbi:MAG: NUDIX domain-containing protein [Lachnospiraceae bacterium]
MEQDCCFEQDGFWFRYRAAAIIIEDRCILMVYNSTDNYYYSVGGGVHLGETSIGAVTREVNEETGTTYQTERLVFVNECLFSENKKQCHVIEFYYLMKPKGRKLFKNGEERKILLETKDNLPERLYWIPVEKLADYKVFPEFFCEKLASLPEIIKHFISDERKLL